MLKDALSFFNALRSRQQWLVRGAGKMSGRKPLAIQALGLQPSRCQGFSRLLAWDLHVFQIKGEPSWVPPFVRITGLSERGGE